MSSHFQVGPWLVQPSLNTISRNGTTVHLEPKVMDVLVCLAQHAGDPVPKGKLIQTVWPDTFVTDDVLKRCISELRRGFEDDARESHVIETIHKRGYRLVGPVHGIVEKPDAARGHRGNSQTEGPRVTATTFPSSSTLGRRTVAALVETVTQQRRSKRAWMATAGGLALVALASLFLVLWAASHSGGLGDLLGIMSESPAIRSLAVLPLQNLSGDPAQEYFSDAMTDALITDLAQIGSLKVVSRTSVTRYKKTDQRLPEIARELNVDGILEGTVQRSGNRVRISAQLIYAPLDRHVWAKSYDRDVREVLALQDELARDVVEGVRASLTPQERTRLSNHQAGNP